MITRRFGSSGPEVGALGLGCSGMSDVGMGNDSDHESIATLQTALDAGVSLLDTADFYGMGHSELLYCSPHLAPTTRCPGRPDWGQGHAAVA